MRADPRSGGVRSCVAVVIGGVRTHYVSRCASTASSEVYAPRGRRRESTLGQSHKPERPLIDPIRNFVQLERNLAAILILTPMLLLLVDDGPDGIRGSISSYHDVHAPEAFYVPLTAAAMLFVVNGVLKAGHWYNWVVGLLLALLIVFDHDGASRYPPLHRRRRFLRRQRCRDDLVLEAQATGPDRRPPRGDRASPSRCGG